MDHKITSCSMEELHILNSTGTLDSLFKYFFPIFFRSLFYFGLGLVPNISLELTIFFYLLQDFVKFREGDVSVLHCL